MRRWWLILGLTAGCQCSDGGPGSSELPAAPEPPADCSAHELAMRELKPWESAGNLVSAVDVGFAIKKMAALRPAVEPAPGLSPDDFGAATLALTLDPRGTEELLRTLPTDDSEAAQQARASCEEGTFVRALGEATLSLPWKGQALTAAGPLTVMAGGPLPTEMQLSATLLHWQTGATVPDDWRALVCGGLGKPADCRLGRTQVVADGPLSAPHVRVITLLDGDRGVQPLRIGWAAAAE